MQVVRVKRRSGGRALHFLRGWLVLQKLVQVVRAGGGAAAGARFTVRAGGSLFVVQLVLYTGQ